MRKKEKEVLLDRPGESSEAGSLERARKVQRRRVLRPRSQAQSPSLLARPVSVAIPSGGAREAPDTSASSAGDRALNDEIDSSSHRSRRRVLEEINSVPPGSSSPRLSPPLRAAGEEIAGHLLTIQQLRGELDAAREAERQHEVEIEELKKKLAAAEAEKVVVQSDLDSMKEKYRREIEDRKDLHLTRVSLAKEYEGVLAVVKGKLEQKKTETAAENFLQETRARIKALTEYSEGGFELEAELERLKYLEVSLDVDYGLASVSDPSLGLLDLPEISGDSVNQD
ncbi:hypothetical protein HID58_066937 [Brassica napus]|uniref:Uncharacterized protein n=1 Tax=Brassica napus TaxID=3708 RepID=A0ABQ7ZH53_BRANA|nr:hypothetical protein HID58_066937 [Brassica napus]